jgi:hypothetical protein
MTAHVFTLWAGLNIGCRFHGWLDIDGVGPTTIVDRYLTLLGYRAALGRRQMEETLPQETLSRSCCLLLWVA